jgi:transcriptional regulator with XRE-family HTH domain
VKPATYKRVTKQLLRALRGPYSQRETADILGITPEGYQEWELGTAQPNPENFRALLDHYAKWMRHFGADPQPVIDKMLEYVSEQATLDEQTTPKKKEHRP